MAEDLRERIERAVWVACGFDYTADDTELARKAADAALAAILEHHVIAPLVDHPNYTAAVKALEAAHHACFKHPDRDVLGMSHGPFSGVNEALGIIVRLEQEITRLRAEAAHAEA